MPEITIRSLTPVPSPSLAMILSSPVAVLQRPRRTYGRNEEVEWILIGTRCILVDQEEETVCHNTSLSRNLPTIR
jgi:hypothetical protein